MDLPLERIECNRFNSRIRYSSSKIQKLASSLQSNGQLVSVKVRPSYTNKDNYELVYGHRRFFAARRLGWKTIRAEVVEVTNEEMAKYSLIENIEREDLSDFEKALVIERINSEFGITYDAISRILGMSKQSVSNYIGILKLFSNEELANDPQLVEDLHSITEHHSRVLSHVSDRAMRKDLIRNVVKDNISVRELARIVGHLRSWFSNSERVGSNYSFSEETNSMEQLSSKIATDDANLVEGIIRRHFRLAEEGDFEAFESLHLIDSGFTRFGSNPPYGLSSGSTARSRLREWFHQIESSGLELSVEELKVEILGDVAVATLLIRYLGHSTGKEFHNASRGTIVLVKREGNWTIFHEHYSGQDIVTRRTLGLRAVPET